MELMAITLMLREIDPLSRHAVSGGPNRGCLTSQVSSFGADRAKHPAARIRKTVPGQPGMITPTIPTPASNKPAKKKKGRNQ